MNGIKIMHPEYDGVDELDLEKLPDLLELKYKCFGRCQEGTWQYPRDQRYVWRISAVFM
jgi:hypothetical protein